LSYFLEESVSPANAQQREPLDETTSEIIKLLSELPPEEKKYLLEYINWRRDRRR
jgi:hypothetical protein